MRRSVIKALLIGAAAVMAMPAALIPVASPVAAANQTIGSGSSFAGNEFQQWTKDVQGSQYNLNVNYQSSSSGQGRSDFLQGTVDFAVTDIRYNKYDANEPDPSTFAYIPVTAGGIAFMYNLRKDGNPKIQLSSLTVCGIFTGAIPYWDDPSIKADNPNVNLPHVQITPVVRSDPAGTNYVMEEYCIALQPDLYKRFAAKVQSQGISYPDNEPTSSWGIIPPIVGADGSQKAADTVADVNADGYITAVETSYATQRHFDQNGGVAAVKNDTGAYVFPTDVAVATALGYATQRADGTHTLNFAPGNAAAYNPSTYSYMLVRLNASPDKGAAVTQFADYCLTIGQQEADQLSYASIGRSLILFGLNRLKDVPGHADPTQSEMAAIPPDNSVASANNGGGTGGSPTLGAGTVSGGPSPVVGGGAGSPTSTGSSSPGTSTGTSNSSSSGSATAASTSTGSAGSSSGAPRSSGSGGSGLGTSSGSGSASSALGSANPAVSLDPNSGPLGRTGIRADIVAGVGFLLLAGGELGRRASRRRRSARP